MKKAAPDPGAAFFMPAVLAPPGGGAHPANSRSTHSGTVRVAGP